MVFASQLRAGMAVRHEGQTYSVLVADYHPGQGKMGGVTHARLHNLATATIWETSFRSELKLEELPVERQPMDFLYADAGDSYFMNPESYEQVGIPNALIGAHARFLRPEMRLTVEFVEGSPVKVLFPEIVEVRIADTAPPVHQQQDNTWKPARLDNGVEVMVPQFIKTGDMIRLSVENLKYHDRAKGSTR
ncbi:MAG: translation elongation factor P [Acidobacteria bacterium]|nr:translation elongation factor P [Acidobacteriota bacterium]